MRERSGAIHHHSHSRNRLLFSKPNLLPLSPTSEFSLPPQTQPESTAPSHHALWLFYHTATVEMRERSGAEMRDREQVQMREKESAEMREINRYLTPSVSCFKMPYVDFLA
jgi:hypothetical protein